MKPKSGPGSENKGCCACPFCDAPVKVVYPFCKECGRELNYCTKCGKPIPPTRQICDECSG